MNISKHVAAAISVCLLLLIITALRYKSGGNYLPVGVQVASNVAERVWVISPLGTAQPLIRAEGLKGHFCPPDNHSGPVSHVAIEGSPSTSDGSVKILLGESLLGATAHPAIATSSDGITIPPTVPKDCTLFTLPRCTSLLAKLPTRSINWAGDLNVILFSLALTIFITLIAKWLYDWVQLSLSAAGEPIHWNTLTIAFAAQSMLRVLALLYLGQHTLLSLAHVIRTKAPPEATVMLTSAVGLFALIGYQIRRQPTGKKADKADSSPLRISIACLIVLLLIGKLLVSGRIPWTQAGDYATYLRLGTLVHNGDWQRLNNGLYLNLLQAQRSLFTGLPASFFGTSSSVFLFWANTAVVCGIGYWVFKLTSRHGGIASGIAAICAFGLHPDLFYGSHLCRHDIPGLLSIMLVCLLWRCTEQAISNSAGGLQIVLLCIACGLSLAFAELSRSLMLFAAIATAAGITQDALRHKISLKKGTLQIITLLFSLALAAFIIRNCQREISKRAGEFNTSGFATMLNALETGTGFSWRDLAPWCLFYIDAVPDDAMTEFTTRKLLFEKIQNLSDYTHSIRAKSAEMGGIYGILEKSGAVVDGDQFPLLYTVPWVAPKIFFADILYFVLLVFALVRCLCLSILPLGVHERWLTLFSFSLIGIMVLLGEPAQQYDYFLAIPLAVNVGIMTGFKGTTHRAKPVKVLLTGIRELVPGLIVLGGLACLTYAFSVFLQQNTRFTFVRPTELVASEGARLVEGRAAVALVPESALTASGMISGEIRVSRRDLLANRIRFLLSADQRRNGVLFDRPPWWDSDVRYRVLIDGIETASGPVSDLATARQVTADISEDSEKVCIRLELEGDLSKSTKQGPPVSIAVEYIH